MSAEMLKRLLTVRIDDDVAISALQFYSTPHPQPSKRVLELRLEGSVGDLLRINSFSKN